MEKRIVGSFNSDEEVLYAIEGLKRKGHRETDMMVVAESTSAIPSHFLVRSHGRGRSTNEDLNRCCYLSMLSAGMGGTQANALSSRLIERGLLEYTKQCEEELNKGKIMLLVDTNTTFASAIAAGKLVNQDKVGHIEDITESPNILIVECNPDIEGIMAEVEK